MSVSNIIQTPIYNLPICVMETAYAVLSHGCGMKFVAEIEAQLEREFRLEWEPHIKVARMRWFQSGMYELSLE